MYCADWDVGQFNAERYWGWFPSPTPESITDYFVPAASSALAAPSSVALSPGGAQPQCVSLRAARKAQVADNGGAPIPPFLLQPAEWSGNSERRAVRSIAHQRGIVRDRLQSA